MAANREHREDEHEQQMENSQAAQMADHPTQSFSQASGAEIGRQIWARYADAPGVIAVNNGVAGAIHRRVYDPVPLLADLQQHWAQPTADGIQTWPELPYTVPATWIEANAPSSAAAQRQVEAPGASAIPLVKPMASYTELPSPAADAAHAIARTMADTYTASAGIAHPVTLPATSQEATTLPLIQKTSAGVELISSPLTPVDALPAPRREPEVAPPQRRTRVGAPIVVDATPPLQRQPAADVPLAATLPSLQPAAVEDAPAPLPLSTVVLPQSALQRQPTAPTVDSPILQGEQQRRLRVGAPFAATVQLQQVPASAVGEEASQARTSLLPLAEPLRGSSTDAVRAVQAQSEPAVPPEIPVVKARLVSDIEPKTPVTLWSAPSAGLERPIQRQPVPSASTAPTSAVGDRLQTLAMSAGSAQSLQPSIPLVTMPLTAASPGEGVQRQVAATKTLTETLPDAPLNRQEVYARGAMFQGALPQPAPGARQELPLATTSQKMEVSPIQRQADPATASGGETAAPAPENLAAQGAMAATSGLDEDVVVEKVLRKFIHSLAIEGERKGRQSWI